MMVGITNGQDTLLYPDQIYIRNVSDTGHDTSGIFVIVYRDIPMLGSLLSHFHIAQRASIGIDAIDTIRDDPWTTPLSTTKRFCSTLRSLSRAEQVSRILEVTFLLITTSLRGATQW